MKNLLVIFLCTSLWACGVSKTGVSSNPEASLQDRYETLEQAVRTLPNVQVSGLSATYRGVNSINGTTEMQFLADGQLLGTLADAVTAYDLNEIRRLRLIKPIEAAQRYGNIASNGIVELVLKK